VADSGGDEDICRGFARGFPSQERPHYFEHRCGVGVEVFTDIGEDTAWPVAGFGARAIHTVHIGGGAAEVVDRAVEIGMGGYYIGFGEQGIDRAGGYGSALM